VRLSLAGGIKRWNATEPSLCEQMLGSNFFDGGCVSIYGIDVHIAVRLVFVFCLQLYLNGRRNTGERGVALINCAS